jgi:hypothetical protein
VYAHGTQSQFTTFSNANLENVNYNDSSLGLMTPSHLLIGSSAQISVQRFCVSGWAIARVERLSETWIESGPEDLLQLLDIDRYVILPDQ